MNELNLICKNNLVYADSRDVAELVGKQHSHLCRDIAGYIEVLGKNPKMDSSKFFIKSSYQQAGNGKEVTCYLLTKKGCDMVANKMTGEKGILFTATYIEKFYEMEQQLRVAAPVDDLKEKRLVVMHRNAKVREANIWLKLAQGGNENFKQICRTYAANLLAEREIVALPEVDRKTYTATEIGKILGISANKVGRLTTAHKLKTAEYGGWYHDKSRYSNKEIETFRYHENVIDKLKEILKNNKKGAKITNDDIIYAQENLPDGIDSIIIERIDCDEEDA